jgi:hypothetical protein
MRDPLSLLLEQRDRAAAWIATRLLQGITRLLRPTPTYIPRYPMSRDEMERVRRMPETSTEDEQS